MKRTKFHMPALILCSMLMTVVCFAGRPGISSPGSVFERTGPENDSISNEIWKIEMQYKKAFITGDSALFLKCYAPGACILAPNAPLLCEQRGLLQFYKGARQAGVRDASFTSLGLFGQTPEYVTQQGAVELFDNDQHSLGKGKVLIVWKKTTEGWRIFRHMLNFDAAMPAARGNQ